MTKTVNVTLYKTLSEKDLVEMLRLTNVGQHYVTEDGLVASLLNTGSVELEIEEENFEVDE